MNTRFVSCPLTGRPPLARHAAAQDPARRHGHAEPALRGGRAARVPEAAPRRRPLGHEEDAAAARTPGT